MTQTEYVAVACIILMILDDIWLNRHTRLSKEKRRLSKKEYKEAVELFKRFFR